LTKIPARHGRRRFKNEGVREKLRGGKKITAPSAKGKVPRLGGMEMKQWGPTSRPIQELCRTWSRNSGPGTSQGERGVHKKGGGGELRRGEKGRAPGGVKCFRQSITESRPVRLTRTKQKRTAGSGKRNEKRPSSTE